MNADRINEHYYGKPTDVTTERARARIHWMCAQAAGRDILDIGCSQGILSLILGREGFQCVGIDLEEASLKVAQTAILKEDALVRGRVTFKTADASNLPFEPNSFDTVFLGEILEHLTHPDKVIGEALRVLREGGRLVVTVPFGLNAFHDHKQTYYPLSLLQHLQPLLRTEVIDTLSSYIVYTGVKNAANESNPLPGDEQHKTMLRLHRLVEQRCLEKERELLAAATKHQKQLKTLTEQSAAERETIETLNASLQEQQDLTQRQRQQIQDSQQAAETTRQALTREAQEHEQDLQDLQHKHRALECRVAELGTRATSDERHIHTLEHLLDQARAVATKIQDTLSRKEVEYSERLDDMVAQSLRQATVIGELQQSLTAKEQRILDLNHSSQESQERAAQSHTHVEELKRAQENHIHSLTERIREQQAYLSHTEALRADLSRQMITAQSAQHTLQQQVARLHQQLQQASAELLSLQQELRIEQESSRKLKGGTDELLSKIDDLTRALDEKDASWRQQMQTASAESAREVQAKKSQIRDLNALLEARTHQHKRQLEEATRKRDSDWERRMLNQTIREFARRNTPAGACVLVVSKGDEDLVGLDGRQGQHFPQTEGGIYAGYHPGTSQEAIDHLTSLHAKGAEYLLIPQPSGWWLEFYRELRQHLDHHARLVAFDDKAGALYELRSPAPNAPAKNTTAPRKNGKPGKKRKVTAAAKQPPESESGSSSSSRPTTPDTDRTPKIGVILDEFTMGCLAPECGLLTFRPDNWLQKLEQSSPRALFVESAWRGNEGAWLYRVASYQRNMGNELDELLQWAKRHDIPSVFWNKEDPVHFERFIERARLFSHVFTTDADCIPRYREQVGHERVFALPFAAQPTIHNPIHDRSRTGAVCFAGTYYGNRHEQRQIDMDYVLQPAIPFGLEIYDRQHGLKGKQAEAYRFPDVYRPCIKGRLDYEEMVQAYRNYRVFLNVNSVKQSPTMFSRRVFELLACGTPVISTYSRGIVDLLGDDIVFITETEADTQRHLEHLLGDEAAWARASTRGIRKVMQQHTYHHRLAEVFSHAGLPIEQQPDPSISLLIPLASEEQLQRLAPALRAQTYSEFNVILLSRKTLASSTLDSFRNALRNHHVSLCIGTPEDQFESMCRASNADYLAFLNPDSLYGPNYLLDYALAIRYSNADYLGKRTHFVQNEENTLLTQPDADYRWATNVPTSTLVARKRALLRPEYLRALQSSSFERECGPILSINRFNFLCCGDKGTAVAHALDRHLRDISA